MSTGNKERNDAATATEDDEVVKLDKNGEHIGLRSCSQRNLTHTRNPIIISLTAL